MDEEQFRRMLELFPVVRASSYCVCFYYSTLWIWGSYKSLYTNKHNHNYAMISAHSILHYFNFLEVKILLETWSEACHGLCPVSNFEWSVFLQWNFVVLAGRWCQWCEQASSSWINSASIFNCAIASGMCHDCAHLFGSTRLGRYVQNLLKVAYQHRIYIYYTDWYWEPQSRVGYREGYSSSDRNWECCSISKRYREGYSIFSTTISCSRRYLLLRNFFFSAYWNSFDLFFLCIQALHSESHLHVLVFC